MRSCFMFGWIAVLVLFISYFVVSTKAQQVAAPTPQLLEYQVVGLDQLLFTVTGGYFPDDVPKLLERALNKRAVEGWEYAGGFEKSFIFKRQK